MTGDPGSGGGSGSRLVDRWARVYLHGVDAGRAEDRLAELRSDVFEHRAWFDGNGCGRRRRETALVGRVLRGIPADLAWRAAAIRDTPARAGAPLRSLTLLASALGSGAVLLILGLVVLANLARHLLRGGSPPSADIVVGLAVGVAATACALALLHRAALRPLGAVWLAFGAYSVVERGREAITQTSTTAGALFRDGAVRPGWWDLLAHLGLIGFGLYAAALVVAWWPQRAARARAAASASTALR